MIHDNHGDIFGLLVIVFIGLIFLILLVAHRVDDNETRIEALETAVATEVAK